MIERAPQPAGLDAHDRIVLRIEIGVAAERVGGNAVSLDAFCAPGQRLVDHEAKKLRELRRFVEAGTCHQPAKRGANLPVIRPLDNVAFESVHGRECLGNSKIVALN